MVKGFVKPAALRRVFEIAFSAEVPSKIPQPFDHLDLVVDRDPCGFSQLFPSNFGAREIEALRWGHFDSHVMEVLVSNLQCFGKGVEHVLSFGYQDDVVCEDLRGDFEIINF